MGARRTRTGMRRLIGRSVGAPGVVARIIAAFRGDPSEPEGYNRETYGQFLLILDVGAVPKMFESLSARLEGVFDRLRGKGKVSEKDVTDAMREVRQALLEADVNFRLVKQFVARVQERAIGQEVLESLSPAQQVIGIVHDELVRMLGGEDGGQASK